MRISKFLVSAAILAAALGAASAADLPARTYTKAPALAVPYDWSGFYIGANAGYASSRFNWFFTDDPTAPGPAGDEGTHRSTGAIVGGQIGYNWQMASWVLGVEAQGNWANLSGQSASQFFPGFINRSRVDALGIFTGRVGYAWNNTLLYAKGGAVISHNTFDYFGAAPGTAPADNRWGGVAGVGLEYGFALNWSLGVEYLHGFFATKRISFVQTGPFGLPSDNISQNLDMVTARVNYRFGGPIVARY